MDPGQRVTCPEVTVQVRKAYLWTAAGLTEVFIYFIHPYKNFHMISRVWFHVITRHHK